MRELSRAFDAERLDAGFGNQGDGTWDRLYAASALSRRDSCGNHSELRVMPRNQFCLAEHEPVPDQWLPGIPNQTPGRCRAIQRSEGFPSSHWQVRRLPYWLFV